MTSVVIHFSVILFLTFINSVLLQGSGENGTLRLCVVNRNGDLRKAARHCPKLESANSRIECVLGSDRLDCLRRISKGTADFGVFSPEDLVALQWARADVLVTHEINSRKTMFERSVVAVVNRKILPDGMSTLHVILKNRTLCHPQFGIEDVRSMSGTLTGYLESLVIPRSCDPNLSMAENKIKALAEFFGDSCKAGYWALNRFTDRELKDRYRSLCSACYSSDCTVVDRYYGASGALLCLVEGGDVTWAEAADVRIFFGIKPNEGQVYPNKEHYAYLCRDGTSRPIDSDEEECVWLHRPWPAIVARRKSSEAVSKVIAMEHEPWWVYLQSLLESRYMPAAFNPPRTPADHLAQARGFVEAYSQSGCDPPRHVTLCTTSNIERNKCEWLSEAASVYGVVPPLQCITKPSIQESMKAAEVGECVFVASSDWLLKGMRDYAVEPLLREATTIVKQTRTVVAYVTETSKMTNMADLSGKRASFPEYDGLAWHSVLRYLNKTYNVKCNDIVHSYFSEICAPGIENLNVNESLTDSLTKNCYREENGTILSGELQALRALVEGKTDVAFISIETYNLYSENKLTMYPWAAEPIKINSICPEENSKYCFISWANLGYIFASKNLTNTRRQDLMNVFTKLDTIFSERSTIHSKLFSLYGPYNHQADVIFHGNTRSLIMKDSLEKHPYNKIPLNFERSLSNSTDSCQVQDLMNASSKTEPTLFLLCSLVLYFISR